MAKDPYRYFRVEARELLDGLTQGILELEKGGGQPLIDRLMRLAHTLKGAARVVKQVEVAERVHVLEDLLVANRDAGGQLPDDLVNRLLALVDSCNERLKPVFSPPEQQANPTTTTTPPQHIEEAASSVRTEVAEVDEIHYDLADAAVRLGAISPDSAELGRVEESLERMLGLVPTAMGPGADPLWSTLGEARAALRGFRRTLRSSLDRSRQDLDRVRDRVGDLRLLPAQEVFAALGRTARDAADALKKQIVFEASGGEHRLDSHILSALRNALIQLVRNAVAHGIEDPLERERAGKPREGRVRLQASRVGRRVQFAIEDDGRGIDMPAIRRVLVARGLATAAEAEALDTAEAARLLFQGGLSTAPAVSEVMGRGVGLDVVRAAVSRLKGDIEFRSEPGRGTRIELLVPVSMESLDVLAVGVGESTWLIPFDSVQQTLRLSESDLAHSATGSTLIWKREAIPYRTLAEVVGNPIAADVQSSAWTAVVIRARGKTAAFGVDRLEGVRNVVVRPVPELCGPVPLVASATLDANGDPQLVFDPAALAEEVRTKTGRATRLAPVQVLPILIVDDSLTTRMLEQSVLETAGYQVDQATSGEEAMEMARRNRYSLFVVDVEMPGMTGFELLERFREDAALRQVPAILVTSRASPEDRQRGERAGARAHIAKGDFHEGNLLRTIRRLIGEASS